MAGDATATGQVIAMSNGAAGEWGRVLGRLREELGETAYRSWLQPIQVERVDDDEGVISLPTRFLRNWIATHYSDRVLGAWRAINRKINRISIIVEPRVAAAEAAVSEALPEPAKTIPAAAASEGALYAGDERTHISAPLDPRFTFANFIVGKPNELAHAAARRVAEACAEPGGTVPFNPLFLHGGVGLGKTHLMHAIAWHVRALAPRKKVIYLSAEKFMYQFVRALRFRSTIDFKEQYRSADLLMIDDVQFISGKESTQEEFFHTFNALVDQNRQIVISADKSPSDLQGLEERMRSRLGWGLTVDIHPTTYELRLGILQSKADQSGVHVPQKVMELLAHKIASNVRELEGALNRIAAQVQLIGRDITLDGAHELLHDLLRANERHITIDEIQKRVAEHFNIKKAEMTSARRSRIVARPRQVAMYLAKHLTPRSLPEIGRTFGGRDHTTVMHAIKRVDELAASDPAFAEDVEVLRRTLQA
jgi:chromosomal replication initiator protein